MGLFELSLLIALAALIYWVWKRTPSNRGEDENICKHCGYDLRASTGRCPECGRPFLRENEPRPLRDHWPSNAIKLRIPRGDEMPVVIHTTDIAAEAHLLREQLDVRGIAARVVDRPVIASTRDSQVLGAWRVMVWSGDQDLALQIRHQLIPQPSEPAPTGEPADRG